MVFPKASFSKDAQDVQSYQEFSPPAVKINRSLIALKSLVLGLILLCAPGNLKGKVHTYTYKHTRTYAYVCAYTHAQILVYTFWRPQPFYLGSGSKSLQTGPSWHLHKECLPEAAWPALMLRDLWSSETEGQSKGLSLGQKAQKSLLFRLLPRIWYPCSESLTPPPCP